MKTSQWPARWGVIGTQPALVGVQGDLDGKALRVGRAACLFHMSLLRVGVMKAQLTGGDNGWFHSEGLQHVCIKEKYCQRRVPK